MPTRVKHVPLNKIVLDSSVQTRAGLNEDVVSDYAEAMQAGVKFPPPDLFSANGKTFLIGDGWHRVLAHKQNGDVTIPAIVHEGGKDDALKFALGANASHGLRRTNADKRHAVELALAQWPSWSDRKIAEVCAVNDKTVASVRVTCGNSAPEIREGRDGKTYPAAPAPDSAAHLASPFADLTPEEQDRLANEAFEFPDEPNGATVPATTGRVFVEPTKPKSSFDSTAWKAEVGAYLLQQVGRVPEKLRGKACDFIIQAGEGLKEASS